MNVNINENERMWKSLVLFLKKVQREKSVTQEELAGKTGLKQATVSRFFSAEHCPKLDTFSKVSTALGLTISFKTDNNAVDIDKLLNEALIETSELKPSTK